MPQDIGSLREILRPKAIPIIFEALKAEDHTLVGRAMVRALKGISHPEVTDSLLFLLKTHPLSEVRLEAVNALGDFPRPDVTKALLGILVDDNSIFRMWAVISLGKLKDPLAMPRLLECLKFGGSKERSQGKVSPKAWPLEG